jgi:asparagine synthase (glutamine-hydrolysing)
MCGLYASIGFAPDRDRLDIVSHRGPDGSGWRVFESPAGPVALGHRRLAIIDTRDCGLQPMPDGPERFWLVFNGEIYNYVELRRELEALGHAFRTDTDSEVLLTAYREWGEACLDRFLGMFAFVIFDNRDKRLFAARDRFGIKPLYVASIPNGIAFASEIKQLLGLPGTRGGVNLNRLRDYLMEGLADGTGETMFAGIEQLRPGECVTVAVNGSSPGAFRPRRWYEVPSHGALDISEFEAGERFRDLLTEAVRLHLRSDVPVGSCLSGGLDSSAIVCLASRELAADGGQVATISAVYPGERVDERRFAEAVVGATRARAHYVHPRPEDVFAQAADLTWHQDEPFGSTSVLAQWRVFAEARRAGLKVMLDGQGADEPLAGYPGGHAFHLAGLLRQARLGEAVRTIAERRIQGASFAGQAARLMAVLLPTRLEAAGRRWRRGRARSWLDGEALKGLAPAPAGTEANPTDLATLSASLTVSGHLQTLLHWEDRSAMAHGIEARVPFLDHRVVEFALALGNRHKIVGAETKRVLRRAMAGMVPDVVLARRDKIGFATPEEAWFRGPLAPALRDGVEATLRRFPALFDAPAARRLANGMLDGRCPVDFALWRLVNLGIWGERFGLSA